MKTFKIYSKIVIIALCLCYTTGMAQGGFKSRISIPNSFNQLTKSIFEISPGNYFGAGLSYDTLNGSYMNRLSVMGLNNLGQLQWQKKYGNTKLWYYNNPFIRRSFIKIGNFIYYAGSGKDTTNRIVGVLVKFKTNGDTAWQKVFRDPVEDVIFQNVTGSVDGGFLVAGFFQNAINNARPCLLIKTDANGIELWRKKLNKTGVNVSDGKAIVQDSASKKIAICGYQYIAAADSHDNILIADSLGNNHQVYSYLDGGVAFDMIQIRDKNLIVVGMKYSSQVLFGYPLMKSYIAKIDINNPATPVWLKEYDKLTLGNAIGCLKELGTGEILTSGAFDTMQMVGKYSNAFIRLTKFDKDGNTMFSRYYDYKLNDSLKPNNMSVSSLELTADGSWIAAIQIDNTPAPNPFFFVKYDSYGCDTLATHCATMNLVGVEQQSYSHNEISNCKIYPNPCSDFIEVDFKATDELYVGELTDALGKIYQQIWIQGKTTLDLQDLNSGIYFLSIKDVRGRRTTFKVVKS